MADATTMLAYRWLSRSWPGLLLGLAACGGGTGGGAGGGGGGSGGLDPEALPDPAQSEFRVAAEFGTPADGASGVEVSLRLRNGRGLAIPGARIELEVSGCGNQWEALPPTGPDGRTRTELRSRAGERKAVLARTTSGGRETVLGPLETEFLQIPPQTFFVRRAGSDASSGRSPREAWRTLDHALAQATPGATIHLGAGEHAGPFTLRMDASADAPLVLAGDPDGRWTGDPGPAVLAGGAGTHALALLGARHVVLQDLTLTGAAAGLRIQGSSDILVLACHLRENDVGLAVEDATEVVVQDCRISANRLDGLRLAGTRDTRVECNLVYANLADGLVLLPDCESTVVRFNTFYRNGGHHLHEPAAAGGGAVLENIFSESGAEALELASASGFESQANLVWGEGGVSRQAPDGVIEGDPLFANPFGPDGILGGAGDADDDFRLLAGSPALDLGQLAAHDVVLGTRESLATRSTRADGLRESSGEDGEATNLGLHVREAELAFASLPKGAARLLHARPGDVRPEARRFERSLPLETQPALGPILDGRIVHLEQRLSPLQSREELIVAQVDTGTRARLLVRHWDGRLWSEPARAPRLDDFPYGERLDQRFDLEYESLSGRAMLVVADEDGIPSYHLIEHGRFGPPRAVTSVAAGAGRVRVVELVPHPGTDELALVTLDDQRDLVVTLWDGTAFGPPRLLEANTVFAPSWRPFDAAFERRSGDLLVSWGFSTFAEETRWATLERASGLWRTGQHPSTDAIGAQIELRADPTSDRIAALLGEGNIDNDVVVSLWNGTEWIHTAELTLAGPIASRMLELRWLGDSGVACAFFRRSGHTGSFNMALWQSTGWRIQPDVILPGVGRAARLRLESEGPGGGLLGMVLDQQGRLFGVRLDSAGFRLLDGGAPLAVGLDPLFPGRPFDVACLPDLGR